MNDQPNVPAQPDLDDADIDVTPPEDEFPPLTDPSTIPADQGDSGHV